MNLVKVRKDILKHFAIVSTILIISLLCTIYFQDSLTRQTSPTPLTQKKFHYLFETKEQKLFSLSVTVNPLPHTNRSSNLIVKLTPIAKDISIMGHMLTSRDIRISDGRVRVLNESKISSLSFDTSAQIATSSVNRTIFFTKPGRFVVELIFETTLSSGHKKVDSTRIYFYIPGNERLDSVLRDNEIEPSTIPRASKHPTEAHSTLYTMRQPTHEGK